MKTAHDTRPRNARRTKAVRQSLALLGLVSLTLALGLLPARPLGRQADPRPSTPPARGDAGKYTVIHGLTTGGVALAAKT